MACALSPSASAFSTMLSAFIGSVINGLCSGMMIAFITGWLSWLAVLRILAAGAYELYLAFKAGTNLDAVDGTCYESIEMGGSVIAAASSTDRSRDREVVIPNSLTTTTAAQPSKPLHRSWNPMLAPPEKTVTPFGWLGWTWSAIYTPLSQSIWLGVHMRSAPGLVQFVRALAIGVSALGLTFDYKQRYAAAVGRRWGTWAFVAFNVWNAAACVLLGAEALLLLIHGAMAVERVPVPLLVVYPVFAIVWAVVSWRLLPPIDGARPGVNVFADVLMGAFAGLFVAAPAFVLWRNSKFSEDYLSNGSEVSGMDLGEFLACEGGSFWEKFAAVMP
ncbi:hypothetical protein M3J09_011087 [Ascochyta lentis]